MKILRLAVLGSVVAVLSGCPSGDKCKDVSCPGGQTCDSNTGMCVNGNAGGGTGGNGGNGGSGGFGGGTIDAGPPIPINMLCDKIAANQCDKLIACKQLDAADRPTCIAVNKEGCTIDRDVNANLATYDGALAAQCLGRLALLDCNDNSTPPECIAALIGGKGMSGAPCTGSGQCQADAGLYCKAFNGCGACTGFSGVGQPCNSATGSRPSTTCQPGLSCTSSLDGGGTCIAPQAPGQACNTTLQVTTNGIPCQLDAGFCPPVLADGGVRLCQPLSNAGQRCTVSSNCASSSLFCNTTPMDGGSALCENRRPADVGCTQNAQCQQGLYCPTTAPRTCRPLIADGQPCDFFADCASSYCNNDPFFYQDQGVDIDVTGTQTCGFITLGNSCLIDDDCGPGKWCKGFAVPRDGGTMATPGACTVQDPDGGACTNSEWLATDSCANAAATCLDAKCVVTPPFSRTTGSSCDSRRQCKYPSYCDLLDPFTLEGHCTVAYKDAGEDCDFTNPNECGPTQTCGFTDTCLPLAHGGQICDDNGDPPCTQFNDCISTDAGADLYCTPWVAQGGTCSTFIGQNCYASYCQADAGTCAARQAPNASCTSTTQCASSRCVNPDGGTSNRICVAACY